MKRLAGSLARVTATLLSLVLVSVHLPCSMAATPHTGIELQHNNHISIGHLCIAAWLRKDVDLGLCTCHGRLDMCLAIERIAWLAFVECRQQRYGDHDSLESVNDRLPYTTQPERSRHLPA